ncbi:MAG: phosphatidylglycerophosphatase A [Acidobacteria bacterium]|nr:phosphatidylglycerophosphatase A [Acidobacteriota bacterium]
MSQVHNQGTKGALSLPTPAAAPPKNWAWAVSTLGGIGRLRPGPGTWASAVTVLLWYFAGHAIPRPWQITVAIAWALAATAIGIPAAGREAARCRQSDPSHVVIDEMAGQMVTLIAAPLQWKTLLAGFILFRCFDILKPPPVRRFEQLPGGIGIVVDDLGAGLYGLAALQLISRLLGWF